MRQGKLAGRGWWVLAAVDCATAALAIWLPPVGADPSALLVAFLLAQGAGLVSASLSGPGAFGLVPSATTPAPCRQDAG